MAHSDLRLSAFIRGLLFCLVCTACSPSTPTHTAAASDSPTPSPARGLVASGYGSAPTPPDSPIVESTEPWTFNDKPGQILRTAHYRIYITDTRPTTLERLPAFMEAALTQYRTAITGPDTPLPYPELRMDTFILDSRPDWERLARQLLGDQAAPFLKIKRGGFAYAGRALLFDVGTHDTLSVAAHEGWHQYTQRTFRQALPIWLEEGLATFMEGHRWAGPHGGDPVFLPWTNVERFDQLRGAQARGSIQPLKDLLAASPQSLISAGNLEPGLVYYAQVWALAQFLNEGAGGRYRPGLQSLLHDAAAGRIAQTVAHVLGPRAPGLNPRPIGLNSGPVVFLAYFNQNLDEAGAEYREFVKALVLPGSRGAIVSGTSPFAPTAPPPNSRD